MTTLLYTSPTIFFTYLTLITIRYGILPSISDSYYNMKHPAWFTLAMFGTGLPIAFYAESGLLFFAGAFIAAVGSAPAFRKELQGKVHVVCAIGGIILGLMACIFNYNNWIAPLIFIVFFIIATLTKLRNRTWWIEIAAYICILTVLFIAL